ncbi:MAG: hypothetical protein ACM3QZ_01830 [Solirubrobacterales bacterium]
MKNIRLVNLGEKNRDQLDFRNPKVYESDSLISSMSYSGPVAKIDESTTFSDSFKQEIARIDGQVSLGTTDRKLRNAHIYSRNALRLDGIERLCYLQQEADLLIVTEFSGNRGAKYSALFRILADRLRSAGFAEMNGRFQIQEAEIPRFVEIVNLVIDDREAGKYELAAVNEIDIVMIKKVQYYYFKAYWQIKAQGEMINNNSVEGCQSAAGNVEQAFRVLVDYANGCGSRNDLNALHEKLDKLAKLISSRMANIEGFEKLSSERIK